MMDFGFWTGGWAIWDLFIDITTLDASLVQNLLPFEQENIPGSHLITEHLIMMIKKKTLQCRLMKSGGIIKAVCEIYLWMCKPRG